MSAWVENRQVGNRLDACFNRQADIARYEGEERKYVPARQISYL
jgi:hypothetical protein